MNPVICYGVIRTANSQQEHYESSTRHAGLRAKELRKLGFDVSVSSLGPQVTNVGVVRMTMITIKQDGRDIPEPSRVERI